MTHLGKALAKFNRTVTPTQVGVQNIVKRLDSGFRGNDSDGLLREAQVYCHFDRLLSDRLSSLPHRRISGQSAKVPGLGGYPLSRYHSTGRLSEVGTGSEAATGSASFPVSAEATGGLSYLIPIARKVRVNCLENQSSD